MSTEFSLNVHFFSVYVLTILLHFQMSAAQVWVPIVFLSFLMLNVTASPSSHMSDEPFRATITDVTNVTYPASRSFLDPDHVF